MDTYYTREMLDKFDKFKQGSFLIFKKWQAFRLSLDNNPELLTVYADEEKTELEIYNMLRILLSDIDDEINKINSKAVINMIGEMLYDFIQGYFQIEVEDQSEKIIARDIYLLHGEIFKEEKYSFLEQLKKADLQFKSTYAIDFPITKKSVQNKILIDKLDKMDFDDKNDANDSEEEQNEDENIENCVNNKNLSENKDNFATPDSDGFFEIKKNKVKKENKLDSSNSNSNEEINKQDGNKSKKENENLIDADGFIEIKKKKRK